MIFKKLFSTTATCLLCCVTVAAAAESEVKLRGTMDFQAARIDSNGKNSQKQFSYHKKNFGFYSGGNIYLDYALISENGLKYGAKLGLEHTFKNNRGVPASVYLESALGRIEGGSDKSAGESMKITGYNASCQSAGGWDMYIKTSPNSGRIAYVTNFCSFLDAKMRVSGKVEYSRKITYYTPNFSIGERNKLQLGISYVPDSSNMGNGDVSDRTLHSPVGASRHKFTVKDGISYGIKHKFNYSKEISLTSAFSGELGKPIGYVCAKNAKGHIVQVKSKYQFKRLNNYVFGSEFKYQDFSVSASYGNYSKSFTAKEIDELGRDTHIYSVGAKYVWDKLGFSLTQFHSNHKKNKLDASTAVVEYNITSGFKTYLHGTYYKANGKYFNYDSKLVFDKSHGNLVLLGAKLSF